MDSLFFPRNVRRVLHPLTRLPWTLKHPGFVSNSSSFQKIMWGLKPKRLRGKKTWIWCALWLLACPEANWGLTWMLRKDHTRPTVRNPDFKLEFPQLPAMWPWGGHLASPSPFIYLKNKYTMCPSCKPPGAASMYLGCASLVPRTKSRTWLSEYHLAPWTGEALLYISQLCIVLFHYGVFLWVWNDVSVFFKIEL